MFKSNVPIANLSIESVEVNIGKLGIMDKINAILLIFWQLYALKNLNIGLLEIRMKVGDCLFFKYLITPYFIRY